LVPPQAANAQTVASAMVSATVGFLTRSLWFNNQLARFNGSPARFDRIDSG
jgi:hypothetical protein